MRSTRDFLTGIITGVVIGILTAPRSGKETREKLTDEATKRSGDLKGQWEKGVAQVKDGYEQVKTQAGEYADKAKDQYEQYKSQAQDSSDKEKMKSQYNDKVDELANKAQSGVEETKDSFKVN